MNNDPKFYINGIPQTVTVDQRNGTDGTQDDSGASLDIGMLGAPPLNLTDFFDGLIDDVRIYNRALSADEIKRLYNMGR
jgi:hypothetical protein